MNYADVKELFDRIKLYYNVFTFNDEKVKEWHKFLKEYDPIEINDNLDKYVNENNEQPPLVYSLTKGLNKIGKEPEKIYLMKCEYCGKQMHVGRDMTNFLNHERECMKIDFISRMSIRFTGKDIVSSKYYNMSKEELDIAYHKILNFYLQNRNVDPDKFLKEIPSD